jgi:hypothetical protein
LDELTPLALKALPPGAVDEGLAPYGDPPVPPLTVMFTLAVAEVKDEVPPVVPELGLPEAPPAPPAPAVTLKLMLLLFNSMAPKRPPPPPPPAPAFEPPPPPAPTTKTSILVTPEGFVQVVETVFRNSTTQYSVVPSVMT